jgi:hypothetical protein
VTCSRRLGSTITKQLPIELVSIGTRIKVFLYKFVSFLLSKVLQQLTRCHGALIVKYFFDMSCEMIVSQLVSSADMHHHWQAKSNLTYIVNYSYNTQSEVIEEKPVCLWLYIYIFKKKKRVNRYPSFTTDENSIRRNFESIHFDDGLLLPL